MRHEIDAGKPVKTRDAIILEDYGSPLLVIDAEAGFAVQGQVDRHVFVLEGGEFRQDLLAESRFDPVFSVLNLPQNHFAGLSHRRHPGMFWGKDLLCCQQIGCDVSKFIHQVLEGL